MSNSFNMFESFAEIILKMEGSQIQEMLEVPSGNLTYSYWKWPFIVDLPIEIVIFHSYVSLPDGNPLNQTALVTSLRMFEHRVPPKSSDSSMFFSTCVQSPTLWQTFT